MPTDDRQTFGQAVRTMRTKSGLTLRELADRCGVDFTYLSKIEHDLCTPSRRLARELCVQCNDAEFSLDRNPLTVRVGLSDLRELLELAVAHDPPPSPLLIDRIVEIVGQ